LSEQVCERLKELRLAKGWSQPRLAGLVSCPRTYISKYERGHCKPTLAVLAKLAEAFQVHLADLVNVQIPANLLIAAGANEDLFMALREALPVLTRSDRWLLLQAAKNLPKGQMPFPDWSPV
jgi:transcriptional regulator with XRE-family HTH domain